MTRSKPVSITIFVVVIAIMTTAGCTWVKPESGAEQVRVLSAEQVSGCQRLGQTTTSVRDRVGGVQRKPGKVADELATLARNSAFEMGGDTIVADSPVRDGQQRFIIYRCKS
jgi:hypothetical protein